MATAGKKAGTSVVRWDEELAKEAQAAAKMEESVSSGQFFGLKSGQLTFNDAPLPNNEMAVVILDSVLENVFYEGEYDPDVPQGPICFAFGREDDGMAPHEKAASPQHEACTGCPMNEWGSADKGRGKACRNVRRLGMIPAGNFDKNGRFEAIADVEHYEKASEAFMKLPVTSVKGFAAYVKRLASALKRPPFGVFTRVRVVPDAKNQFSVQFEALEKIPDDLMPAVMARHKALKETIEFPYTPPEEGFEQAAKGKKPAKAKAAPKSNRPPVKRAAAKY